MVSDALHIAGLRVSKRAQTLLGPIEAELPATGVTIILGPNGAGKTTLLRALHGLERIRAGHVTWPRGVVPRQAFVFQTPIMMRRSVLENLIYPQQVAGVPAQQAVQTATDWAMRIGLADRLHQPAPRLSGGEKQKLALARALILRPDVLMLDEPCASLDGRATRDIEALLQEAYGAGVRILMSTHNIGQARRLAGDVVFMVAGQIVEQASAAQFFDAPQTAQARAFLNGDIVE